MPKRQDSKGFQGLKPMFFVALNVAAEAATHKDYPQRLPTKTTDETAAKLFVNPIEAGNLSFSFAFKSKRDSSLRSE
jgi:hypothetical protein